MSEKKDERYKYFVYKLCSDFCDDHYIGSTRNMVQRRRSHKSVCNNPRNKGYNQKKYQTIRDNCGFENWRLVILEIMENTTKLEAEINEQVHRVQLRAMLNSQKASCGGLTKREYNEQYQKENKEQINEQKKIYRQDNKEQINEQKKQKFDCDCGGKYTRCHKTSHEKSKKHQNYVDSLEPSP